MTRPPSRLLRLGLAWLIVLGAEGCGWTSSTDSVGEAARAQPSSPLPHAIDKGLITRGLSALESKLPSDASFLEIRLKPALLEIQLIEEQSVTSLRYRETPTRTETQLSAPVGQVDPPAKVPIYGKGDLKENGFAAKEVDLTAVASAFPVAIKAVDPSDGWIKEVVVRRYLPFGTAVRARIFVESPRMAGSIDTNGNGVPLRACY